MDISRYNRAVFNHSPLLKTINLSIAVLFCVLLITALWFLWRPMPQLSGEMEAPIGAGGSIVRDDLGVPHVTAESIEDVLFLQGFATAQDRMWQMDVLRRSAAGELAEIAGPAALENDREARRLRVPQLAAVEDANLDPELRRYFAAYARGVNYYLEQHAGKLPTEFLLMGYSPRPWHVRDTLLIGLYMYRSLQTSWQQELRKLRMVERGDPDKVDVLFPERSGYEAAPGSNAWAISGDHTASGVPVLANDPHLQFSLPSIWHMVQLTAPDLDVVGATIPGVPAVIIGHNQQIAWGMTNLEFDMQDLYEEQIDGQTGQYVYRGQVEQGQLEQSFIAVKDQNPEPIVSLRTRHGPVILTDENNQTYSLRWVASEIDHMTFPFLAMNQAQNWEEFQAALSGYNGPAQNFVFADKAGNIGYHVAGAVPLREEGCHGDVPSDGSLGQCEWQGLIDFDALPELYNPESGMIVSANQDPFPDDPPYPVAGVFDPAYRARQIRARLGSRQDWAASDMIGIQVDVYSALDRFLAQRAAEAWNALPAPDRPAGDQVREAIGILENFDGQMQQGLAAPVITRLLYDQMTKLLVQSAAPDYEGDYTWRLAPRVVQKLWTERPAGWFEAPPGSDADPWDVAILDALEKGLARGTELEGSSVARWSYGRINPLELQHPVFSQIPLIGDYFKLGPVGVGGSPYTVKQMTQTIGPSYRMAVELGDLEASTANLPAGESGSPLSSHYSDQWDAYVYGTSFPMQFANVTAEDTLTVVPMD